METDFINYHTRVESYYKTINSDQNLVIIGEKRLVDKYIGQISSQLKDVLTCNIKLTFITDFPYEGKNSKLDKLRKLMNVELIKIDLQDNSLLDKAFQLAEEKEAKKIIYLQNSILKTEDKKKLNHINERNQKKLELSPKLTNFVSQVFSRMNQSQMVERFHMINILCKRAFYKELFTVDGAGDGNGVLIANNYDVKFAKLLELEEDVLYFLYAFIKDNQKFIKKRDIDYIVEKKDNIIIGLLDGIPIGMFELMDLGDNIVEIGAFIIDENSQGLGLGYKFLERMFFIKDSWENKDKQFIMVTFNPILKSILKDRGAKVLELESISSKVLKGRYENMLKDNKKNNQDREMFILS